MNRRRLLTLGALGGLAATASGLARRAWGSGNPYYSGPVSDHFDGTRFFNPGGAPPKGFGDLLRWWRQGDRAAWPERVESPHAPNRPAPRVTGTALRVTAVGHATLLIQTAGMNILTDPFWSDRASPLAFVGPRRAAAPGIALADLPPIDLVLLTHNHYDHLDIATLRHLRDRHAPHVVTPLGNDRLLDDAVPGLSVTAADWGQAVPAGAVTVHLEPCHHWSARGTFDRSQALWAAFVLETPGGRVLHIGDTGFDGGHPYRRVAERHGALRAALLPIGAYEPRWFMRDQHQNPAEAVEGFRLSGAAVAVGHHWGTIQLTDEAREAPLHALETALDAAGIARDRFRALHPGQAWDIP